MNEKYYIPYPSKYVYESQMDKKTNNLKKYSSFLEQTNVYYLSEALSYMLDKCLDNNTDSTFSKEMCRTFVRENGYENLMRQFKIKTYLLAEIAQCVDKAVKSSTKKANKEDPLTWVIKDTEQANFFDSLRDLPVNQITKIINKKVCDAAEDFVQKNINMKLDIEEIATKAKNSIDAAKEKYNEKIAESVQKEETAMYKNQVEEVKRTATRNIYGHMMNIVSKTVLENEQLKDSYLNESGRFDMSKVESKVKTMYTFLEMVNSLKIKKVDNKYIEECLASIG